LFKLVRNESCEQSGLVIYDVAIVGAGPAGSACAAICAGGGMRTVLLDRAEFPREKVCGDCLNPAAWPVLERLGVEKMVHALPHAPLREVELVSTGGKALRQPLPEGDRGEIGIRRSVLDDLLARQAIATGAEFRPGSAVERIEHRGEWTLTVENKIVQARHVVAADGRNSTVARLLGLLPPLTRDRVAWQARLPLTDEARERVVMRFLPQGYSGLADIGGGEMNLCLVARPQHLDALRAWAQKRFQPPEETVWQSVTPLSRRAIRAVHGTLLLVGDAARVLEPFTGEGITYALATGELAGRALLKGDLREYTRAQANLYRGRLWLNQLARAACLHPGLANTILQISRIWPGGLRFLTRKVTAPALK
jgi:geranylgeranyl reductase family protein